MKKFLLRPVFVIFLCLFALAGCGGAQSGSADASGGNAADAANESEAESAAPEALSGAITVVSREDGSGTRGAFIELFGVQDEDKTDRTAITAEITNNTAVMMTSVAGNENAIGYISLGSLNNSVKALRIDGAAASADNINNGSYTISRPFLIALKGAPGPVAQDFIDYIMSTDGQDIIESNGYIRVAAGDTFTSAAPAGKIIIAGSSSVTPIMEKLTEAYLKINADAEIEIQQSDSSTGMNAAIDGVCDIGMASRELKDSEIEKGLSGTTIAMDGIAVIVNLNNPIDGLGKDQVRDVFMGAIGDWSGLQ
ncbi:MAG: substrate-binding domain-containing protein [Clostridiales Family XIII bacterium]|nr:substrate-binding domain-containing protein [Clostridiales Family XIII bacterium]